MANLEQKRHYEAMEAETHRNNLVMEGIKQGELNVDLQNAQTRVAELENTKKETAANVKLKKAQTKNTKASTKKTKAETKKVRAEVKSVKANTKKAKRETKHIGVEEAQEQARIQNQREANAINAQKNAIQSEYNRIQLKLGKTKNQNEQEKIKNDYLVKCFDNPALLAYSGLIDEGKTSKQMQKSTKKAINAAIDKIKTGTGGAMDGIAYIQKLSKGGKLSKTEASGIVNIIKFAYMLSPFAGAAVENDVKASAEHGAQIEAGRKRRGK
jgi:chromosome segregation ATPase